MGAKYEIYELIINMAKQGKTIIVVSSEMPEILGITNRIGVMSNGRLSGIVNTKETNQEEDVYKRQPPPWRKQRICISPRPMSSISLTAARTSTGGLFPCQGQWK